MNYGNQISYTLCGAIAFSLCAAVNAEEVATHSLDAHEKVLLMETINVTSNKEIAAEDLSSDDPEVDQVLSLVDGLALLSDELTEEQTNADTNESSNQNSVDLTTDTEERVNSKKTVQNKDKLSASDSKQTESQQLDTKQAPDKKTDLSK